MKSLNDPAFYCLQWTSLCWIVMSLKYIVASYFPIVHRAFLRTIRIDVVCFLPVLQLVNTGKIWD